MRFYNMQQFEKIPAGDLQVSDWIMWTGNPDNEDEYGAIYLSGPISIEQDGIHFFADITESTNMLYPTKDMAVFAVFFDESTYQIQRINVKVRYDLDKKVYRLKDFKRPEPPQDDNREYKIIEGFTVNPSGTHIYYAVPIKRYNVTSRESRDVAAYWESQMQKDPVAGIHTSTDLEALKQSLEGWI